VELDLQIVTVRLSYPHIYKKYGVVCSGGISRSVFGTALKILTSRSVDVLNFKIDATFPHR